MKAITLVLTVAIMFLSLIGCDMLKKDDFSDDKQASLGGAVDNTESDGRASYPGADIRLVRATALSLEVVIENNTESTWQSGNMKDYFIEAEKDGSWYKVEQIGEFANTLEFLITSPGEKVTHTFDFTVRYGALPEGRYRFVKSYWANATKTESAREFWLVCEFTV